MDEIKNKIEEVVNKIKNDGDFASKFKNDPVKTVEDIVGVDLPDDQVNQIVGVVKAKVNFDSADGIVGKIKGLF